MTLKTYREAIIEAMILEMKRDEKVFVIGEDISGGRGCVRDILEQAMRLKGIWASENGYKW